jgi:hypothetical protein
MAIIAGVGLGTTLLELMATSIGFGVVIVGFAVSCAGMIFGWTRKELEADALRHVFWGGVAGMYCLCLDLIVRFLR